MKKILIAYLLTGLAAIATVITLIFDIINYIKTDAFPIIFILPLIAVFLGLYSIHRLATKKTKQFFEDQEKFFEDFD